MNRIIPFTVLVFLLLANINHAAPPTLPLDKKIMMEKALLAEDYSNKVRSCQTHKIRSTRNSCMEQKKEVVDKALRDLQENPKAYFTAKEQQNKDEKTLLEARRLMAPRKTD